MDKKVILVTGASSGMGKDFALTLLGKGHVVYGLARRVEKMQEIVQTGGKRSLCRSLAKDYSNNKRNE